MKALTCTAAVLASLISLRAEADTTKAWAAAKDNLPTNTRVIGGLDVAAAVKTPSYAKLFSTLVKSERDFEKGYEMIKKGCGFDPATVVDGVVLAGTLDHGPGVAFVQLTIDRAKATTCIEGALQMVLRAQGEKPMKIAVKADGIFTSFSVGHDAIWVAWVASDVVAIAFKPENKPKLEAWIGQKGFAKSELAAQVAKADTKALAWGAFTFDKPIDKDMTALAGYGALTLAKGTVTGAIHATFPDAKAASATVAKAQKEIEKDQTRKRTPDSAKRMMKAITFSSTGSEAVVKGSVPEADLLDAALQAFK